MSTPLCRHFQRGSCHFGSQCKFIHPGQPTRGGSGEVPGQDQRYGSAAQKQVSNGYNLPTAESIGTDLLEKPMWILSSYGPGKNPPVQLIDGKDISFEEARVLAYQCQAEGNPVVYEQQWIKLNTEAEAQIRNVMSDLPGAVRFLERAQGNRDQTCKYKTPGGDPTGPTSVFSLPQQQQSNATRNPFGAPAQPTPSQSAFGQPTFGQPSQPTISLTAPSPFAAAPQPPQPAFGRPAFGQTSTPQSAFGKPAQPAFGQPAFGQTSTPQGAFGKLAFGQPAFGQPGFAATQQPQQAAQPQGAFGVAGTFGKPAFGQLAFGQTAFGQPSTLGAAPSPFAAAAQNTTAANPFTAATQPQNNASPFAAAAPNQPQDTSGPFGGFTQQAQQGGAAATANPFGQPQGTSNTASAFSQANPFQQAPQAQQANPVTQSFGKPTAAAPTNAFATASQPQSVSPFSSANPFQSAGQQQQQQQQQPPVAAGTANPAGQTAAPAAAGQKKKWDDPVIEYTAEELAAFVATNFTLGNIPTVAPPGHLCF